MPATGRIQRDLAQEKAVVLRRDEQQLFRNAAVVNVVVLARLELCDVVSCAAYAIDII